MHMERRQSIKAVARSTAIGGTFQASLRPVDVLTMDDIAERWASYSGQPQGMAKSQLIGFESFILDQPVALLVNQKFVATSARMLKAAAFALIVLPARAIAVTKRRLISHPTSCCRRRFCQFIVLSKTHFTRFAGFQKFSLAFSRRI